MNQREDMKGVGRPGGVALRRDAVGRYTIVERGTPKRFTVIGDDIGHYTITDRDVRSQRFTIVGAEDDTVVADRVLMDFLAKNPKALEEYAGHRRLNEKTASTLISLVQNQLVSEHRTPAFSKAALYYAMSKRGIGLMPSTGYRSAFSGGDFALNRADHTRVQGFALLPGFDPAAYYDDEEGKL